MKVNLSVVINFIVFIIYFYDECKIGNLIFIFFMYNWWVVFSGVGKGDKSYDYRRLVCLSSVKFRR